jgi:hypothetical protein
MDADQHIWRVWILTIRRWGVQDWVASLLEAAGPFTILGAQMVYFSQPLWSRMLPEDHFAAAARLLEQPSKTQAFVQFLRESSSL